MKIALVPSAYLPSLGGVQELTRLLALSLDQAGMQVEIWTHQGVGEPSEERLDGLMVRRFDFELPSASLQSVARTSIRFLGAIRALRRAAKAFEPDVINVVCFGPNGAYSTLLSQLLRIPLVITLQGETVMDDHDVFDTSTVLRTALKVGIRRAARVTGCSKFTLDDARTRFGLAGNDGTVIFNGVDLANRVLPMSAKPATPDRRYLFALGRVVKKKGFDLLIAAFASISDRHPDVDLLIAGSGEAEDELQSLIGRLELGGRVELIGRRSREEVADLMDQAEAFVMPSRLEPFGIVILEAWRAGCAAVISTRGGPPEFVDDGETGLLVDPFDRDQLAHALDRVLGNADLRRSLGDAARKRVKDFAWPLLAEAYLREYDLAVTSRR